MSLRVTVVGSPGHGKSTFLNSVIAQLAKNVTEAEEDLDELFKTGCDGTGSITKSVSDFQFDAKVWRKIDFDGQIAEAENDKVRLTLIDTMGFPDPDKAVAAEYYDEVVTKAVNNPNGLNAVIWVLNHDRPDEAAMQRFSVLMNQLASCTCKFIVVVNGRENYSTLACKRMSPERLQRKQESDRRNMFDSCKLLLDKLEISKGADGVERMITIIPSTNQNELEESIPRKLMAEIIDSECVCSSVHTYKSMIEAYATDEKARQEVERCAKEAQEKRKNAEKAFLQDLERIQTLKAQEEARAEKEKEEEKAAEQKRLKAKGEAEILQLEQKKAEAEKAAAESEQSRLDAKRSVVEQQLDSFNCRIQRKIDEIASLSNDEQKIYDDYAFAFNGSGGRVALGIFTLGGSELHLASSRSEANHKMELKRRDRAACEKYKKELEVDRDALKDTNPDLGSKLEEAKKREEKLMDEIRKKEEEFKKKQREQEEQEAKRRQAQANATQYQERARAQEQQLQGKKQAHQQADDEYKKVEDIRQEELRIQSEIARVKKEKVDEFARYLGGNEAKMSE